MAESDEAPVPEQGVYDCWMVSHPLIGDRLLAAGRLAPDRDQRFDLGRPLKRRPALGVAFTSVRDLKERFVLRSFPKNHNTVGAHYQKTSATCRVEWTIDFHHEEDHWQLDGHIEAQRGGRVQLQHKAESVDIPVWAVAEAWGRGPLAAHGRWCSDERQLAVSVSTLSPEEQESFRRSLDLTNVQVAGNGQFQDARLEDVPVCPDSDASAQEWALLRFGRALQEQRRYRSRSEVRRLFFDLTEGTPLETHAPELPSHQDLVAASQASKDLEIFWSLVAPVDLAPFPVSDDSLASVRVGTPETPAKSSETGRLCVPYRGGWSMEKLVDALLEGESPSKVLLCDRYVRGDNLATLVLWLDALRAVAADVTLEVWTEADGDNQERIEELGCRFRRYRDVFGRARPHDRYVLVRAQSGTDFGWHLTNSPLHARADVGEPDPETPLRWKDLGGSRVARDLIDPRLEEWLAERRP